MDKGDLRIFQGGAGSGRTKLGRQCTEQVLIPLQPGGTNILEEGGPGLIIMRRYSDGPPELLHIRLSKGELSAVIIPEYRLEEVKEGTTDGGSLSRTT